MATVSLSPLKAWIASREAYEHQHGEPPPLTDAQRAALAVLVPPPPSLPTLPDDYNWVSLLMRYCDARGHGAPTLDEEPVVSANGAPSHWRCRFRLPHDAPDQLFPQDSTVAFLRKKDAKQHAARCTVEWLIEHHYMPADGRSVTFAVKPVAVQAAQPQAAQSPPPPQAAKAALKPVPPPKPAAVSATATQPPAKRPKPTSPPSSPPALPRASAPQVTSMATSRESPSGSSNGKINNGNNGNNNNNNGTDVVGSHQRSNNNNSDDEEPSHEQRLNNLCRMMNLGTPRYEVKASETGVKGFFDGTVQLLQKKSGRQLQLPEGVGEVRSVLTRKGARERLAQSVLDHLEKAMQA